MSLRGTHVLALCLLSLATRGSRDLWRIESSSVCQMQDRNTFAVAEGLKPDGIGLRSPEERAMSPDIKHKSGEFVDGQRWSAYPKKRSIFVLVTRSHRTRLRS
jgi:hypothetical protein